MLMLLVSWASAFQLAPWKKTAPTFPAPRGSLPPEGALRLRAGEAGPAALAGKEVVAPQELKRWQLRMLVAMTFAGWIALIAGWYVTEIGRQPWLVTGVLTAAEAASKVPAPRIALTLALYLTLYSALIVAYISVVFYIARHRKHADQPFGDDNTAGDTETQLNVVNYPEKEGGALA
jgi:cytochrome d ubiquinol oxidase subunit I